MSSIKSQITKNINEILTDHIGIKFKIGKTGDAQIQVDMEDYRQAISKKCSFFMTISNPI
jgi:hypothetical protein